MILGTALTKSAFRVMFLGGGELGKEVVIALQRLGVEVVVVDQYEHAPAMQVAHRSHVITMTDANALYNVIMSEKPHLIVPEIEAIATEVLLKVEEDELAMVIPTARAVHITMNREKIRRLASEELKLPTSNYCFAKSLDELKKAITTIGFPCFIKPVMSSSGKGQSMITSAAEIDSAWEYANQAGRVNKEAVIVEAKINFEFEITLLTVRAKNAAGIIETYFCNPIGHRQSAGDYVESWQPQPMSEKALIKAHKVARTITDNLGGVGVFGVEFFVCGDEVWFSEVSPRPHDTGMVTMITQYQNEFELHARAILGLPVNTQQKEIGSSHVIYAGMNKEALSYANLEQALTVPNSDLRLFAKPVGFIKRRMGVALCFAESVDLAKSRAKEVAETITVIG